MAKANVTIKLMAESSGLTRVDVAIELSIPGKSAQFGRGIMQDVAGGLVTRFAGNLEQIIAARSEGVAADATAPAQIKTGDSVNL